MLGGGLRCAAPENPIKKNQKRKTERRHLFFIDSTGTLLQRHLVSFYSAIDKNESWGLFGTLGEHAEAAWPIAMTAISDATYQPLDSVRAFLDSRHGRHFADDVLNGLHAGANLQEAIHAATQRWMGWSIGRLTSKQHGIPKGLPYLTGFVIHCEIVEEALAD